MAILGVAIELDGVVYKLPCPNRHHNVIRHIKETGVGKQAHGKQGFYNHKGEFLDREQAREYALRIGQVRTTEHARELFSKDLW